MRSRVWEIVESFRTFLSCQRSRRAKDMCSQEVSIFVVEEDRVMAAVGLVTRPQGPGRVVGSAEDWQRTASVALGTTFLARRSCSMRPRGAQGHPRPCC